MYPEKIFLFITTRYIQDFITILRQNVCQLVSDDLKLSPGVVFTVEILREIN